MAELVKDEMGSNIFIEKIKSDDLRSYHISSEKIKKDLNFQLKYDLKKAIKDLINAFEKKCIQILLIMRCILILKECKI